MALQNVQPGTYPATLIESKLLMVEKINQPCVVLKFQFEHDGETDQLEFKSFLQTLDGYPNKKTINALKTVEFISDQIEDLNDQSLNAVNKHKKYTITLEKDKSGKFINIAWVNDAEKSPAGRTETKNFKAFDFSKFNEALKNELSKDKNGNRPDVVDGDEIPF